MTSVNELFINFKRGINDKRLNELLDNSWNEDPVKTIAIIFNSRDRKDGNGEKQISNKGMLWMRKNKLASYNLNILNYINKYGCWKDILYINYYINDDDINYELNLMAVQLTNDKNNLLLNNEISLCAKWAPSENDRNDKRKLMARKLALLLTNNSNKSLEIYRKEYLVPLRKKINIVENLMCINKWDDIIYDKVPSIAYNKYKKAFNRHDKERFQNYLSNIKNKNNISSGLIGLLPSELIKYYFNSKNNQPDETVENVWKIIIENYKQNGIFDDTIACICIDVNDIDGIGIKQLSIDISLALLISQCNTGIYKNKIIISGEEPYLYDVEGDTLFDLYNSIIKINTFINTNVDLEKIAKLYNNDIIKRILFLSETPINNYNISELFVNTKIIYWNLNKLSPISINNIEDDIIILTGYSDKLLKIILNNKDITCNIIINGILNNYIDNIIIDKNDI